MMHRGVESKLASLLTARRLRAHGLMLALGLWSVYLWNISTPGLRDRAGNLKGTDFLHFYTIGSIALSHRAGDLYDLNAQADLASRLVPQAAGIRYLPLSPPQVSMFFAPFALLSYPWALSIWLAGNAAIYGFCCYAVWRACPSLRERKVTVVALALAFPAFWHLILWGQTSALALACFTLAFFAWRADREFLAGLAFGCLMFKPQLALAAGIVFLLSFRGKVVAGAILSAAAQMSTGVLYYGWRAGWRAVSEWVHILRNVKHFLPLLEPRLYQTHCLRTFWAMLMPWPSISFAIYVVTTVVTLALAVSYWRGHAPLPLRYAALLLATVLVSPHLTVYDLVILAPAFLLLADWIAANPTHPLASYLKILVYLAFVLPLLGPAARWTHVQFSVPVMAALLVGIWKVERKPIAGNTVFTA